MDAGQRNNGGDGETMSERRNLLQESLSAIERLQARLDASERARHEPIAIIGAGCRYPGGIENPADLWRVVRDGVDAVSEVPADRWDANAYYDPDPQAPGKMITRRGGFLSQVDRFDAQFFGISPREASTMDPQQRLLLETATEALESAGLATDRLAGSATGVFVGITTSDYGQLLRVGGPEHSDVYSATGSALNAAAGRVSFTYGFQGPCLSVDTACSSSLVAVHLACQSLRAGESDLALAGGVNVILSPDAMVLFSKWGMMAPDGACKTFDASADGFVRAEGCAVIALKRLADARAAGDPILAVIRGSAVNSDGRSSGLTVPNGPAQQAVLRRALSDAMLNPADVDYVEAHGTGTPLGDPIEIEALGTVMRSGREADRPLKIGSVKTNLGHTEAASGLAGLLKVVMALRHEAIPPHLHFSTPNPGIPWSELPLSVPTRLTPWPRGERPRRAGVSSFGFSGTNAPVILEEAPVSAAAEAAPDEPSLVVLSARSDAALRALARRHATHVADEPETLRNLAATLATGRTHYERRLAFVADSVSGLKTTLARIAEGERPEGVVEGALKVGERPRIAFLFTGQGAQYAGMASGLYESEPAFRAALDSCADILRTHLDRPLRDVLFPAAGVESVIAETAYTQPALFAVEYALAELWRSWGITPSVVVGHSVGEYVAACVAGVFSLEDGLALVAERGRLMQSLPSGGGMAAVFAEESVVRSRIAPMADRLAVAAVNGPEEVVVSGDADALRVLLERCEADGIRARSLEVSHAFHSARLDGILDAFERRAAAVACAVPRIPLVSNLTGEPFAAGARPDARYWRRHARETVRFAACVDSLTRAGVNVLLEVGPHPTLLGLAARVAPQANWTALASLRRGRSDRQGMLASLGALYARGAAVKWDAVMSGRGYRRAILPTYPFQRERHWVAKAADRQSSRASGHSLLGAHLALAGTPGAHVWEREISLETHPWVTDHRVQGAAILPATAYIEMALQAGREILGECAVSVSDIEVLKPMILHEDRSRVVQTTVTEGADGARLAVHSRPGEPTGGTNGALRWTAHVTARLTAIAPRAAADVGHAAIAAARSRCDSEVDGSAFYAALAQKGNQWGPRFQGMDHVWSGGGEAVGRVRVLAALDDVSAYRFHPAVSDACGHALVATVPIVRSESATGGAFVGGGVGEVRFYRSPVGTTLWTHATLRPQPDGPANTIIGDVEVYDESGALISETLGARLWYLDDRAESDLLGVRNDWYYRVGWHAQPLEGVGPRRPKDGPWLIFADQSGLAERIASNRRAAGLATVLVSHGSAWTSQPGAVTIRATDAEHYRQLLSSIDTPSAILHLWTLDSNSSDGAGDPLAASLSVGVQSVVHLLQAVRTAVGAVRPRIWLATSGVQPVLPDDRCAGPWNATLWGLGKSLSAEHSELWGGLVDLPANLVVERDARRLVQEVEAGVAEDKVALRADGRYVPRLERRPPRPSDNPTTPVRADATYLITGGMGGIGLAMAGWLAENGARHLLLIGRTVLPPPDEWPRLDPSSATGRRAALLASIAAMGVHVETRSVDVAKEGALRACLDEWSRAGHPEVRGVIHAAGVLQFQTLETLDVAALRASLAGKVDGAWHLHRTLRELDFFVLCSSTSALLNSPMLGGYAAANAFLDALAWHRRASGLSALSVNWGTWGEVGMAVESGRGGDMLSGIGTIPTTTGLSALGELLQAGDTQAAVMPVDWGRFASAYPAFVADPFFAELLAGVPDGGRPDRGAGLSLAGLRDADVDARPELIRCYLRTEAARVLGLAVERLDPTMPLSSLGFDSLMAVQLKNRIETDLHAVLPMMEFLQGPSVDELSATLLRTVDLTAADLMLAGPVEAWEEGSL
jgi:acyl transferase domain-containing protein/acyl carrier protein